MIKDSGERTTFKTGAKRDVQKGKGRNDLMPLIELGAVLNDEIVLSVGEYNKNRKLSVLVNTLKIYIEKYMMYKTEYEMAIDLSKHFENGAKKYGERNWEKGIPKERYVDSAIRHYLKFRDGQEDENHEIAFVWNVICLMWTENKEKEE